MTLQIAYNTTDAVTLVDELGYTIGGRSWGVVDSTDPIAKQEFAAGRIIQTDEDSARGSDLEAVREAVTELDARRKRLADAKAQSKAELAEALPDEVVESLPAGSDGLPSKDDLVDATVATAEDDTTTKPRRGRQN